MTRGTPNSPALISLAVLKANWDVLRKDYLENFVPMVAECIRVSRTPVVSVGDLQVQMQARFGLRIPQHVLDLLLKRLRKRGYLRYQHRVYSPIKEALSALRYAEVQQAVMREHETLIQALVTFCNATFQAGWTTSDAELALQSYLKRHELPWAADPHESLLPGNMDEVDHADMYVGAFIRHLQETASPDFQYLATIFQGNMLANAIFLADPAQALRRFNQTEVYLDTSFLIYVLGYAGPPRQAPCLELLQLLRETGAKVCCFRHTLLEVQGILEACAIEMAYGREDRGSYRRHFETIEYFIRQGCTPSDIEEKAISLEANLHQQNIAVLETPGIILSLAIDEEKLHQMLAEKVKYWHPNGPAVDRDVASISAVYRLQRGHWFLTLEDCPAIFVTTNKAVAQVAKAFFGPTAGGRALPWVTDAMLTHLLWLKKPLAAPDLPRKRIIADAYAATQPSEHLWRQFLNHLEALQQSGQVTLERYYELRYSLVVRSTLMEITKGEIEALTKATVAELIRQVEERKQAEVIAREASLREQIASERERANQAGHLSNWAFKLSKSEQEKRKKARQEQANKVAHRGVLALTWTIAAAFVVASVLIGLPLGISLEDVPVIKWALVVICILIAIISAFSSVTGFVLKPYLDELEGLMASWVEKRLQVWNGEDWK